jgi:hypothetical protein
MSKLVIDADGLIKLGKSKVLGTLVGSHEVLVPEAVHEEAVVRGKRELYEDAFELERVLKEEGVYVSSVRSDPRADRLLESVTSLGEGERETLRLYFSESADAVVSDDRVFLSFLGRHSVPFLTPVNVIVGLAIAGQINFEKGFEALERLREYVGAEVYEGARKELEDLREGGEDHG